MSSATARRRLVPRGLKVFLATLAVGVVVLASLSEVFLPGIAERRLRATLAGTATDVRVDVHAEPAIKLLAGRADRVEVRLGTARVARGRAGDLVTRAKRVGEADVTIDRADLQGLALERVRLRLRDGALRASAVTRPAAIKAVLPRGVRLVQGRQGDDKLAVRAGVAGVTVTAQLRARAGRLVVEPDSLLGGVFGYTVWADPRVRIESIGVTGKGDGPRTLSARATLD